MNTVNRRCEQPVRHSLARRFPFGMAGILAVLFAMLFSVMPVMSAEELTASGTADPRPARVWREITDPCLRQHWQWIVDAKHPGWPARLVLVGGKDREAYGESAAAIVIRSGDLLTVDQDSGALTARFQAIALESAASGEPLQVRLALANGRHQGDNFGLIAPGPVIRVIATGRGEAKWEAGPAGIRIAADRSAR
jgi:hypothetical protein